MSSSPKTKSDSLPVDDDPLISESLAFVLRDSGFQALLREGADFAEILTATAQLEPRG